MSNIDTKDIKGLTTIPTSQYDGSRTMDFGLFTPADGDRDNLRAIVEHIGAHARHGVKMYAK